MIQRLDVTIEAKSTVNSIHATEIELPLKEIFLTLAKRPNISVTSISNNMKLLTVQTLRRARPCQTSIETKVEKKG